MVQKGNIVGMQMRAASPHSWKLEYDAEVKADEGGGQMGKWGGNKEWIKARWRKVG